MKKLVVLLLAFAMVGSVFAQAAAAPAPAPATLAYKISGDAYVKWGYDLGTGKSGFQNVGEFDLTLPLIANTAVGAKGENVYGEISISDVDLSIVNDEGEVPAFDLTGVTIAAKVNAGNAYFGVYSKPSFTFTNASYIKPYSIDGYDDLSSSKKSKLRPNFDTKGGVSAGYKLGDLGTVEARIGSIGDWGVSKAVAESIAFSFENVVAADTEADDGIFYDVDFDGVFDAGEDTVATDGLYLVGTITKAVPASANNQYSFGFNTTLTPVAMVTINAGAMFRSDNSDVGLTAKVTLKPIADLTVTAGVDALNSTNFKFDLNGKVAYALNEGKDTVSVETYFADKNAMAKAKGRLDLAAKIADVGGLVPEVSADFGVFANDLMNNNNPLKLTLAGAGSYKYALSETTYVKPSQAIAYDLSAAANTQLYSKTAVEAVLFPNTTFTLAYQVGAITDDVVGNGFVAGGKFGEGLLTFTTKIAF